MHKRIKILFVLQTLDIGGSENVVLKLIRNMNLDRYEIYVFGIAGGRLESQFVNVGAKIIIYNKRKGIDYNLSRALFGVIKEYRINIVNTHHFSPLLYSVFGVQCCRPTRLLHTEHTMREMDPSFLYPKEPGSRYLHGMKGYFLFWIYKYLLLQRCSYVIAISKELKEFFAENMKISRAKISTIFNAVEFQEYSENEKLIFKNKFRHEYGVKPGEVVIGCVARFRPQKNHSLLLNAFAHLLKHRKKARLVLVGDGGEFEKMRELAYDLEIYDNVCFLGAVSDVGQRLYSFDIFCLTSNFEGLPLSILEAMYAKIPVIGTEVSGITELIENGKTGCLVPLNSPQFLADKIDALLREKDYRSMLVENAFTYVAKHHNIQRWAKEYENLFEKCLR